MTNTTTYRTSPRMVRTSTVKQSAAARPSQCAARKVFHGIIVPRSGGGSTPWSLRIALTVLRAMSWPRLLSAADARVSPGRVFRRHANDERGDVWFGVRATGTSLRRAVVLLGDECPVPAQDGVGCHDAGDDCELTTPQDLACHGETASLVIGEPQSSASLGCAEDAVFFT